jgi:integrase
MLSQERLLRMKNVERSALTEAEVRRLKDAAAASPPWGLAVALMVDEGLRVGEMFALRGCDVDLESGQLRRPRVVEFSDELLECMRDLVESRDRNALVFDRKWTQPQVRQQWRELTRQAGVEGARLPALRSAGLARMFEEYDATGKARPALAAILRRRPGEVDIPFNK